MANVVWTIAHAGSGAQATFVVSADQMLPVPTFVDDSGQKRAGDCVAGDYFRNAGVAHRIVTVDVEEA